MRKNLLFLLLLATVSSNILAQQKIKDGTVTGSSSLPNANAILELESNNKGMMLPRVALVDTALSTPLMAHVKGMVVYDTATHIATGITPGIYYNDGSKWIKMNTGVNAWQLLGNAGTTSGANGIGDAADGNYIGTTDRQSLVLATNGIKRMVLDTLGNAAGGQNSYINVDGTLGYTSGNFIWGMSDTINNDGGAVNGYNNVIFGFLNKSTAANTSIFGIQNKDLNTVLDEGYNFIAGDRNTITDPAGSGASANSVLGSNNILNSASANAVLGNLNTINLNRHNSTVLGLLNTVEADTAYAIGFNNKAAHNRSFAIGDGAVTTTSKQFSANFSGGYRLLGLGDGAAADSIVTDSAGYLRRIPVASLPSSNIYTTDGALAANRTVNMAGNILQFSNTGGSTLFDNTGGTNIVLNAASATGRANFQATAGSSNFNMFVDGGNKAQLTTSGGTTGLDIATTNATSINFITDNSFKATITPAGNLGIGTNIPNSTLQVNGSVGMPIRMTTGSTTLTPNDYTIIKTGTAAVTITLPAANTCAGRIYRIVEYAGDGNSSTVTISPAVQTYDSFSGLHAETNFWLLHTNLTAAGTGGDMKSLVVQSDGVNWYSIGR